MMSFQQLRNGLYCGLILGTVALGAGCAGKRQPLEDYRKAQLQNMDQKSVYRQADFDFWAAAYEPTLDDLEALRTAWVEHGQAFPESPAFKEIEKELRNANQRVVLVSLFMTAYENADLRAKNLGWAVHPVPAKITELTETDVVLRTLMPVENDWARYFILRYPVHAITGVSSIVISNPTNKITLQRKR